MSDQIKNNPGQTPPAVISLHSRSDKTQLERINRLTGLDFDALPASLLGQEGCMQLTEDDGEELIYRALYLWSDKPPSGR